GSDVEIRPNLHTAAEASLADRGSALTRLRLAQAGSTGGTLGKPDQSLSGDKQKGPAPKPQGSAKPAGESSRPSYTLSGAWDYTQDCQIGSYRGNFQFSQTGAHSLRGTAHQVSPQISSEIFDAAINGNRVSFKVTFSSVETWTGSLSGSG